jgi:hypothetical protein
MITYFDCPDGLAFDSNINSCNFPKLVKCKNPSDLLVLANTVILPNNNNNLCKNGLNFYQFIKNKKLIKKIFKYVI